MLFLLISEKPCTVDGWDCAFTTDLSKIPKTENHSTVEELLTGFFEFFVQFDFGHKIMSIRSGESIHLTSFSQQMASDSRLKGFKVRVRIFHFSAFFILPKSLSVQ